MLNYPLLFPLYPPFYPTAHHCLLFGCLVPPTSPPITRKVQANKLAFFPFLSASWNLQTSSAQLPSKSSNHDHSSPSHHTSPSAFHHGVQSPEWPRARGRHRVYRDARRSALPVRDRSGLRSQGHQGKLPELQNKASSGQSASGWLLTTLLSPLPVSDRRLLHT